MNEFLLDEADRMNGDFSDSDGDSVIDLQYLEANTALEFTDDESLAKYYF